MYKLNDLPYAYNDLEPYIDALTVEIHYTKHHTNYLNKVNTLLETNNYSGSEPLNELVAKMDMFSLEVHPALLFNIGGVLNHDLYWQILSPNHNIEPVGKLKADIDTKYGSFELFKTEFIKKATSMMGSGWTFLVINNKELEIINCANQETPYSKGMIPIMILDLWEHAYYLKYRNLRADYITNFFNIIDFKVINELYEKNI